MRQPQENVDRSTVNTQKLTFFFGQDSCAHLLFQVCLIFKGIWSVRFTGQPCASICMRVCCSVVSSSLQPHGLQPSRLLFLWNSPGKTTRVDSHSFLQETFLMSLLHCRELFYCLSTREALISCIIEQQS